MVEQSNRVFSAETGSPEARIVGAAFRRGAIPQDAAEMMLSHPAMKVFAHAHLQGKRLPEAQKQLKRGLRRDVFGTLPPYAEEILLSDALTVAKPKIVSTGFDPVRLEGILADLDAAITEKHRQAVTTPVPALGGERVVDALERVGFMQRVDELVKAGRVTPRAEGQLQALAGRSGDVREFAAALSFGGLNLMGKTELRYVSSTLHTPEGQQPWQVCEAHVRAFDQRSQHPHQRVQDQQLPDHSPLR